ncbi:MAG: disulfide reductase, partial [Chloroflexi bacterium]|nr:disulfide reductase [Chloroflexota bacterium]
MKYNYYPGCSLERNAHSYHDSAMAVGTKLGIEFVEVEDWNCCGATEYMSIDKISAFTLSGRNLALAYEQKENGDLVAPCSLCLLNLQKSDHHMQES